MEIKGSFAYTVAQFSDGRWCYELRRWDGARHVPQGWATSSFETVQEAREAAERRIEKGSMRPRAYRVIDFGRD